MGGSKIILESQNASPFWEERQKKRKGNGGGGGKKGFGWIIVLLASHPKKGARTQIGGSSNSLRWRLSLSGAEVSGAKDEVEGRREALRSDSTNVT